jgi:ribonuclease Z
MSGTFRPRLVNGRFGDPALFVGLAHEYQAVLFDLGDLSSLSARELLRIGTIGVSHMHIDHLIGFDALLRVNVGRDAKISIFGPAGLADRLGHKLQGYSWDLVDRYDTELVFEVSELVSREQLNSWSFRFSRGFVPEPAGEAAAPGGLLIETPGWRICARILEHHGPCLGFAIEEPRRINVWRNRVEEMGLAVGPWLKELKDLVREGREDDTAVSLPDGSNMPLASLRHLVSITCGMKIGYATDISDSEANRDALRDLCGEADILFIEAAFAARDAGLARARAHLTTTAAGEIARECGVRRVEPFHFSHRYEGEEDLRLLEVQTAFEQRPSEKGPR